MKLPTMIHAKSHIKNQAVKFGGYNNNEYAGDGEIRDMKNMTSDFFPILASRAARYKVETLTKPNGLFACDGLFKADGINLIYGDKKINTKSLTDGKKQFAALGAYIVIFPDKVYYNKVRGEFGSLEESWNGNITMGDGTYAGIEAKANTIKALSGAFKFSVGDAVEISGCTESANNKTAVIREISDDKKTLRFYEFCFTVDKTQITQNGVTIARKVPDMDYICVNENRLWGCKGDTIYASKLGDVFNFNVFESLSTSSYSVNVGSAGDFTACVSYMGYPIFFKEEGIYKVYGNRPDNFQVIEGSGMGVQRGSSQSLAVAGETLFYLSRSGVTAYTGGVPQSVAYPFGMERYKNAVAGSDGIKYYTSMENRDGEYTLFVFDTRNKLWHKEDDTRAAAFAWDTQLYMLKQDGTVWLCGSPREVPDTALPDEFDSFVEFGDFTEKDFQKKGILRIHLRLEVGDNSCVRVALQMDSSGIWQDAAVIPAGKKRSCYLPVIPRRCDHYRIRIFGTGEWKLYSMTREFYRGSSEK